MATYTGVQFFRGHGVYGSEIFICYQIYRIIHVS